MRKPGVVAPAGTRPPLMSHEDRRKLIEAPVSFYTYGSHYAHGGCTYDPMRIQTLLGSIGSRYQSSGY